MSVKQIRSIKSMPVFIGLAILALALMIPGQAGALPVSGYNTVSLAGTASSPAFGANSLFAGYALPKTPLLGGGYSAATFNHSTGFAIPASGQVATGGTTGSASGSSALSGLFANAMSNYHVNPPKPITNASPSSFLVPALGTDNSWDAMFNPPVYHGCGCG